MNEHDSEHPDLSRALAALAKNTPREASFNVEFHLREIIRRRRKRRERVWAGAAIAALCLLSWLAGFRMRGPAKAVVKLDGGYYATAAAFLPLPYADSSVPLEEAVVVRVRLSSSELQVLGVTLPAQHGGAVNAELLVGQDGMARAVRLAE